MMNEPGDPFDAPLPSERSFGLFFATVFAAFAAYSFYTANPEWRTMTAAVASLCLLGVSLSRPSLLAPLNRSWFRLGVALARITNPIVLGLLFFLAITPIALCARLTGRDPLRIRRSRPGSFWIERDPTPRDGDSFRHQF